MHIQAMVQIACTCGSIYEVTTHHAPMGDSGVAICKICERELDRWSNVTIYETYVLVKAKESKNSDPAEPSAKA
jgi:hypothetical protein